MDFEHLVSAFGWPGALLVVFGIAAFQASRFLKLKLFDDTLDSRGLRLGYVPRVVDAHLDMVAAVKMTAEENTKILKSNEGTNREILLLVREGREETRAMNRAIEQLNLARITQGPAPQPITGLYAGNVGDKK